MSGRNVGDLLNEHNISWGWFQGGFRPTATDPTTGAVCGSNHKNVGGATVTDYIPHHEPFQYYPQTANPNHMPPATVTRSGTAPDPARPITSTIWSTSGQRQTPARCPR